MANAASLAGHITIGDHAIIGGLSGIHQYVRIGAVFDGRRLLRARAGPPAVHAGGRAAIVRECMDSIRSGLRRQGFSADRISVLKQAYDMLFRSGHRMAEAARLGQSGVRRSARRDGGPGVPGGDEAGHLPIGRQGSKRTRNRRSWHHAPHVDERRTDWAYCRQWPVSDHLRGQCQKARLSRVRCGA